VFSLSCCAGGVSLGLWGIVGVSWVTIDAKVTMTVFEQVDLNRVTTVCSLLKSLLCGTDEKPAVDFKIDLSKLLPLICTTFLFAYLWGLGGNLVEKSMDAFDTFCRDLFGETHDVKVS